MSERVREATNVREPGVDGTPQGGGRRGGCGRIVLGLLLVAIGIPMLVLPGPGIAAILGGVALVWRGVTGGRR